MDTQRFTLHEDRDNQQYILTDNSPEGSSTPQSIGLIDFVDAGPLDNERVLFHTEVNKEYSGQGLAGELARFAVESTINSGKSVVPVCPFVAGWLPRHPEYAPKTVQPEQAHLDAVNEYEQRRFGGN